MRETADSGGTSGFRCGSATKKKQQSDFPACTHPSSARFPAPSSAFSLSFLVSIFSLCAADVVSLSAANSSVHTSMKLQLMKSCGEECDTGLHRVRAELQELESFLWLTGWVQTVPEILFEFIIFSSVCKTSCWRFVVMHIEDEKSLWKKKLR